MNPDKYRKTISLQCPRCSGTQFETSDASAVTCASCGNTTTRDALQAANKKLIDKEIQKIGAVAAKDLGEHLKKSLADAFRGNKHIKIK